jgi:hypothetical protein
VALILNVAVVGMLYLLFGRVLGPSPASPPRLADLGRRNYRVRLPRPRAQELAAITDRFNALAQALDGARAENERLNHRLITAQDDERRRTALELHDEVGPSLFGLKANASSIATAARELPSEAARKLSERARDMLAIIEHLQGINRSMLNRLRPMALGHVPLADILSELVRDRARQHPQIRVLLRRRQAHARLWRSGRPHGLSPASRKPDQRHPPRAGRPRERRARRTPARRGPGEGGDATALALAIRDDGRGIDPRHRASACAAQERVQALGSSYKVESARGCMHLRAHAIRCAAGPMTSVLIIDDHPIVLQGCRRMLEDARWRPCSRRATRSPAIASTAATIPTWSSSTSPCKERPRGLDIIRRMRSHDPRARILVFSMHSDRSSPHARSRPAPPATCSGHLLGRADEGFDQVRAGTPI